MKRSASMDVGQVLALDEQIVTPKMVYLDAEICTLGRAEGCQILVRHPLVSRLHARIERNGPRYVIADAGSVNGTYVNGRRLTDQQLLTHDDTIGLGSARPVLRFIDPDPTHVAAGQLIFDEKAMVFLLGTQPVDLTPNQFKLLHFLFQNAGEVCTRESCAQAIWGREYAPGMDSGAFDQTMTSLRGALRAVNAQAAAELIETKRGLGYVLHL